MCSNCVRNNGINSRSGCGCGNTSDNCGCNNSVNNCECGSNGNNGCGNNLLGSAACGLGSTVFRIVRGFDRSITPCGCNNGCGNSNGCGCN